MTTINIDLSERPLAELDIVAGQAVFVPKTSAQDLSKMEELAAATAVSEAAAGEYAQAAQGSATMASESATTVSEHAQAIQGEMSKNA